MENRAQIKFIELKKMIISLNESIELVFINTDSRFNNALRDSVIQRFEYTIEGIWKFIKYELLEEYGEDVEFAKNVLKQGYKAKIINNLDIYLDMIEKRNRLSHDYHEDFAELSFDIITEEYIDEINNFLKSIGNKYE